MDIYKHEAAARLGVSESAVRLTIRRRRRRSGRHGGRLRTGGVRWHATGSRRRYALVLLAIMALTAAGAVGVAMVTYGVWPG